MSDSTAPGSAGWATFALCLLLFFGGIVIGQGTIMRGPYFATAILSALWLLCIGIYNIGKAVGRDG